MPLLLADPQDVTRYAIGKLAVEQRLFEADEVCAVPHFTQLKNAIDEAIRQGASVTVVIDYALLNCSEEELTLLHQRFPAIPFVLFSDQLSRDFLRRMLLPDKTFSVVLKDSPLDEIHDCLADAVARRQYICPRILSLIESQERQDTERSPLTATEREILKSMSLGHSTKEIAAERFLSVYTVMTHRKNIFRKLRVNNAQEAIRYALRAGIVDPLEYYI